MASSKSTGSWVKVVNDLKFVLKWALVFQHKRLKNKTIFKSVALSVVP